MGWQDDPIVDDQQGASSQPWMNDPVMDSPGAQAPMPTMGEVALNAVPKGIAGVINTPNVINHLILKGAANLPGMDALPGVKKFLEEGADKFARNAPEHLMEMAGIVDPAKNPQTGPQRIVDAAIQGAVSAATPGGGLKAAAMGAASGATGKSAEEFMRPIVGDTAAHWIGVATGLIPSAASVAPSVFRAIKPAPHSPLNTKMRLATLEAAQKEGFVVEPESVRPTMANNLRSSVAGGGKLKIAMAMQNQKAATELAKKDLGLPPDAELTPQTFVALKKEAGKPYEELKRIPGGATLLEQVQQKRSDAAGIWRAYGNEAKPSPELRNAAIQAENDARALDVQIDQLAQQSGVPGLLARVQGARKAFGKIYDVEAATNVGDGHVSLPILGGMADADGKLTGGLLIAGKFHQAFKPVAREGAGLGTLSSGTDAASSAMLGTVAGSNSGSLLSMLAGAVPFARQVARNKSMSPEVQQSLTQIDPSLGKLLMRPDVVRGLSRAALLGNTLANLPKGNER